MRRAGNLLALTIAITFALIAPVVILAADPPDTYIRAGHLLDVRTGKMLSNQVIVIQGERGSPLEDDPTMAGWEERRYGRNVLLIWQKDV